MIYVTGRCIDNGKLVGYRLYDYDTKQWKIAPTEAIKRAFMTNKNLFILGLEYFPSDKGLGILKQTVGYYKTKLTDEVNGAGETIDKENHRYVLLTVKGLKEKTKYICVEFEDTEVEFNKEEFIELIKQHKVIGASLVKDVCIADYYKFIKS